MSNIEIKALSPSPEIRAMLSEILIETVANGGSVSFMHPLSQEAAEESLIGTVTLLLDLPPNQPHRAEIAKMMTRVSHRHRGIATALLREAERMAIARGRWLLVLDTAEDEGAAGLYERMGFKLTGVIPDYALKPHGGLTGTLIYWKRLQEGVPA
jgi:ribosomal protein S18 acetylase RimI-like enzyme